MKTQCRPAPVGLRVSPPGGCRKTLPGRRLKIIRISYLFGYNCAADFLYGKSATEVLLML